MAAFEPKRCYVCKKLFCCIDCRINHTRKKHPELEPNCSLCDSGILIIGSFNNDRIFCHVVFKHLPLQCQSCGDIFACSDDLHNLGICSRRLLIYKKSNSFSELSCSVNSNLSSVNIQTPSNSLNQRARLSIEGNCFTNLRNFISPQLTTRDTSTPMQIGIIKKSSQISKFSKSPNISFRTLESSVSKIQKNEPKLLFQYSEEGDSPVTADKSLSETVYFSFSSSNKSTPPGKTPLKSILTMNSECDEKNSLGISSEKKLNSMQESEDVVDEIKFLSPKINNIKDSEKRVRFSDEFDIKKMQNNVDPLSTTEGEEFFEACQNISEISITTVEKITESTIQVLENSKEEQKIEKQDSNKIVNVGGNDDQKEEEKEENPDDDKKKKISESRVVMMLLVEKTGGDYSPDLAPLIDSGLKKLQKFASNALEDYSPSDSKNLSKPSIVSVDTFSSVLTVERFKAPESARKNEIIGQRALQESSNNNNNGGILNTFANALKNTFKSLSGGSTKIMNNESVYQKKSLSQINSTPTASSNLKMSSPLLSSTSKFDDRKYSTLFPSKSASSVSSPPSSFLSPIPRFQSRTSTSTSALIMPYSNEKSSELIPIYRSAKRGREEDLVTINSKKEDEPESDERSPLQKRRRGWYKKIRGRDPIARMKNSSAYSSQKFFQPVDETILPLPYHAHQATQTD